uniref:ribosomal protein S3 n=1 Tax=Eriobotrya prinoides TaxID=269115 RepID=UPI0021824F64|nr:ribosomal protein S3 [Eriobotrya prinoides]UVI14568.1 ribosomal protein S3 [Eriobotrya prinoides]
MGQKINPLGFRLGATQGHHSLWFAQPKNYSKDLQEDQKIRDCIKNYVQNNMKISSNVEGIARIEIQKRIDLIQVIIYMGFPKLLIEDRTRRIEELQTHVQKELNCVNRKLNIAITRIANPYGHPNIYLYLILFNLYLILFNIKLINIMGERRELNPRMVDSQSTALIHLATSAPCSITN